MVYRWMNVEYEGFTFTVQGDWEESIKGDFSEPKQQAGFYEYDILIDNVSIHELLLPGVSAKIVDLAEEALRGMD